MVKEYRMYYFFSTEIKGIVCVGAVLLFLFYTAGAVNHKTETSLSIHSPTLMSKSLNYNNMSYPCTEYHFR